MPMYNNFSKLNYDQIDELLGLLSQTDQTENLLSIKKCLSQPLRDVAKKYQHLYKKKTSYQFLKITKDPKIENDTGLIQDAYHKTRRLFFLCGTNAPYKKKGTHLGYLYLESPKMAIGRIVNALMSLSAPMTLEASTTVLAAWAVMFEKVQLEKHQKKKAMLEQLKEMVMLLIQDGILMPYIIALDTRMEELMNKALHRHLVVSSNPVTTILGKETKVVKVVKKTIERRGILQTDTISIPSSCEPRIIDPVIAKISLDYTDKSTLSLLEMGIGCKPVIEDQSSSDNG